MNGSMLGMLLVIVLSGPALAQQDAPQATHEAPTEEHGDGGEKSMDHGRSEGFGAKQGTASEATMNKEGLAPDALHRGKVEELDTSQDNGDTDAPSRK